jgi:hypothetical protein
VDGFAGEDLRQWAVFAYGFFIMDRFVAELPLPRPYFVLQRPVEKGDPEIGGDDIGKIYHAVEHGTKAGPLLFEGCGAKLDGFLQLFGLPAKLLLQRLLCGDVDKRFDAANDLPIMAEEVDVFIDE